LPPPRAGEGRGGGPAGRGIAGHRTTDLPPSPPSPAGGGRGRATERDGVHLTCAASPPPAASSTAARPRSTGARRWCALAVDVERRHRTCWRPVAPHGLAPSPARGGGPGWGS